MNIDTNKPKNNKKQMREMFIKVILLVSAFLFFITGTSCSSDSATSEQEKEYDMSGFAKGADVS